MNVLDHLHEQLEIHKKSLKDVDESIKRLNGSENAKDTSSKPGDRSNSETQKSGRVIRLTSSVSNSDISKTKESQHDDRSARKNQDERTSLKRKSLGETRTRRTSDRAGESRDSSEDESPKKPTLQSSVVSSNMPIKTKEDLIKIQNKFNGSEQRNKRIFGVILGTLRQFKTDDTERSSTVQALNRKELEKKIEIKKVEEKKRIQEEKRKLEEEKYRELRNIEIIEQKIRLTEDFESWKETQIKYKHFIRTKAEPSIHFLPKEFEEKAQSLLDASKKALEEKIDKRRKEVEKELESLTAESIKLNNLSENKKSDDKENKKDSAESDSELDEEKNDVRIGDDDEEEDENTNNKKQKTDSDKTSPARLNPDDSVIDANESKMELNETQSSDKNEEIIETANGIVKTDDISMTEIAEPNIQDVKIEPEKSSENNLDDDINN